jgi:hypothetical protein
MKTPLAVLKAAVKVLNKSSCSYCLIGGHAASLYRAHERVTRDVDFALVADPPENSRDAAEKTIKEIGLEPMVGFIPAGPREPKRRSICMVTSKPIRGELKGIIDILLPVLPWIEGSVRRAQGNKMNLSFASVPVITPEDLVIAKCYALRNNPERFQDLDDLKEIFLSVKDLDFKFIGMLLDEHGLEIPEVVRKFTKRKKR